jgi:hypothetical protein
VTLSRRRSTLLIVLFIAVVVNFPLAHTRYLDWKLGREGVRVAAQVEATQAVAGDEYLVRFTVPAGEGRKEFAGAVAQVDRRTYDEATDTGVLTVTVLPHDGAVFSVDGQTGSHLGLVVTLLADLFLLAVLGLAWRLGAVMRVELVLRATEDLQRCPPGSRLDRLSGQRYLVAGEVAEISEDEVVLDLGDRRVRVLLDGYANPAGYQQPVSVVGYMVA